MDQYRVIINDKPSQTLYLDPDEPLVAQLRERLKLRQGTIIKARVKDEFEPLDTDDTLKQLGIESEDTLYISIPPATPLYISIPPSTPWLPILAGIAVLLVVLVLFVSSLRTFFPQRLSAPTIAAEAPTTTTASAPEPTIATSVATTSVPITTVPSASIAEPTTLELQTEPVIPSPTTEPVIPSPTTEPVIPSPTIATPETATSLADPNTIEIAVGVPGLSPNRDWQVKAQAISNSAQLAIDDYKGLLTIPNLTIKLGIYNEDGTDAQDSPNSVPNVAQRVVDNENVLCVVGHYSSGASREAKSVYQPKSLAMITPSSSALDVTDIGRTVWRLVGNDKDQGIYGARFAAEVLSEKKNAFVVYDVSQPNTREVAGAFRDHFLTYPQRTVDYRDFDPQKIQNSRFANDIALIQDRIEKGNKPHIIYFAGRITYAQIFLEELQKVGVTDIPIIGIDTFDSPELLQPPFLSFNEVYATTMAQPLDFGQGKEFAQKFANRFQVPLQDIPGYSAEAYDATALCVQAIVNAAQTANGKPSRTQVLDAMRGLTSAKAISQPSRRLYAGPYEFKQPDQSNPGDLTTAAFYVRKISSGELTTTHRWNRDKAMWEAVSR